ncbi:MAG: hypothetical protein Q8P21_01230 [bacterium]|nr:hypothetical protein [bacterium]
MKRLTLVGIVFSLGCGAFSSESAPFVAYNTSNHDVVAVVNDGQEFSVPANRSIKFEVRVPVPKNPVGAGTGPSSVDKAVQVSVAFRNLTTGRLTRPILCSAGAKVVTHIWYEMFPNGFDDARCTSSY